MSCEGDTSAPQGTAPVTFPGTGTCCQCPLLIHSFLSHSATFPFGPGSSAAGVSQGPGAGLQPPPKELGLWGSIRGSVLELSWDLCPVPLVQDVHFPSIPFTVFPSFLGCLDSGGCAAGRACLGVPVDAGWGGCPQRGGCWGSAPCPWVPRRIMRQVLPREGMRRCHPGMSALWCLILGSRKGPLVPLGAPVPWLYLAAGEIEAWRGWAGSAGVGLHSQR